MLIPGLYEKVINKKLQKELNKIPEERKSTSNLDIEESSKILTQYLSGIIEKSLDFLKENRSSDSLECQVELINKILSLIKEEMAIEDFNALDLERNPQQLLAILKEKDPLLALGKKASDFIRPETSIAQSSLFTGAVNEPQMFSELKKEILSSDEIYFLVSFIKWSGLRLIFDELKTFTDNNGKLKVISTSYMGATDLKAIEELKKLNNTEIRISYDTTRTRLHAKTYIFHRNNGFTTAYVGSSNLSNAAISSGLEWNMKITREDMPETIDKIAATFESYWNSSEFEEYEKDRLSLALKAERSYNISPEKGKYVLQIKPYPYQEEILEKLNAERTIHGKYRNLVVAATGTGKTVISAFDYKRFRSENKCSRLLFVAHREEILIQSISVFRAILRDENFGDLQVGSFRPENIEHLFISIQNFNSRSFETLTSSDYYNYIIVDEFHHAAAPSYQKLLSYYKPNILLGLTATPERLDGRSILQYFDNRIAAEIRLPEAIERKLLCPFQYFGVSDSVDLKNVKWKNGGYDTQELTRLYTFEEAVANKRADQILHSVIRYVTDLESIKALCFCVSVAHAEFMNAFFKAQGLPSICLTGSTKEEERQEAKKKLVEGSIRFIFVVDLYNEGVDIPEVNTVLFLRPTESLTVFLQQLGRGLRLSENKECLTVLDFIGNANKKYSFEEKFRSLLARNNVNLAKEIKNGFTSVPKGCYIQLEKMAQSYILQNIRRSYDNKSGLIARIIDYTEDHERVPRLSEFLETHHLNPKYVYKFESFSRLKVLAGVSKDFKEPVEKDIKLYKLADLDSVRLINFILSILDHLDTLELGKLSPIEKRMLQMFHVSLFDQVIDENAKNHNENLIKLSESPTLLKEIRELLQYKKDHIDFIDSPVDLGFECPLDLHCTYTRDQILVAMDFLKPNTVREGVKWLSDKKVDIFFITLNKTDKDYSPTTMYKDYSINETLFHWQSQSTTNEKSTTGIRYINHKKLGSKVVLFVREKKNDDIVGAGAYTYLGTANYKSHTGSNPMNITWCLDHPIPSRFLKKTNKLVVG